MILQLSGSLTTPNAEALQRQLLAALNDNSDLQIDLSDATEIDVSFLQLLIATQQEAASKKSTVKIHSGKSALLVDAMQRCGLSPMAKNGHRIVPEFVEESV